MRRPDTEWADEHEWGDGDDYRLLIPDDDSPTAMMLPVWGWATARHCYRVEYAPGQIDALDTIAFDVFERDDGRVLIVNTTLGHEKRSGDDRDSTFSGRVWEGPGRAAEPPIDLVDSGRRSDIDEWLFDDLAAVKTRWLVTDEMVLDDRITQARAVLPEEVPEVVRRTAERRIGDHYFSRQQRDVSIDDEPRFAAQFPLSEPQQQTGRWGLAYDGTSGDETFLLIVVATVTPADLEAEDSIAYADELESAIDDHGESGGLLRVVGRRVFDRFEKSLEAEVSF